VAARPSAADRWAAALAEWAIPQDILDAAPVNPWVHAPRMFASTDADPSDTPSMHAAAAALGDGGDVLDVGCGGGRSSLPLAALITHVTGVDQQQEMLDQFRAAAARAGVPCDAVLGRWLDVQSTVLAADVVVCHHVVYNVGDIGPFIAALHTHARRAVVVELTANHPQSSLNDLWRHFWGIERPTEPSADLFVEVVGEAGHTPVVQRFRRSERASPLSVDEHVANVRQRLCLTADRDAEIAALLGGRVGPRAGLAADEVVTVWWHV